VFDKEPSVPEELFAMENVVLQPHVGSATHPTRKAMGQLQIDNLAAYFAGKPSSRATADERALRRRALLRHLFVQDAVVALLPRPLLFALPLATQRFWRSSSACALRRSASSAARWRCSSYCFWRCSVCSWALARMASDCSRASVARTSRSHCARIALRLGARVAFAAVVHRGLAARLLLLEARLSDLRRAAGLSRAPGDALLLDAKALALLGAFGEVVRGAAQGNRGDGEADRTGFFVAAAWEGACSSNFRSYQSRLDGFDRMT
jgi:hypothetical protein